MVSIPSRKDTFQFVQFVQKSKPGFLKEEKLQKFHGSSYSLSSFNVLTKLYLFRDISFNKTTIQNKKSKLININFNCLS